LIIDAHGVVGRQLVPMPVGAGPSGPRNDKVLVPLALPPVPAGVAALTASSVACRIAAHRDRDTVTRGLQLPQVVSASIVALAHGTDDAQRP
jgi:inorganic phosphate transporter, PiT family